MQKVLNRAHLMTGYSKNRQLNDLYNTPPIAIETLLKAEKFNKSYKILEPCCGSGNISEVLKKQGFIVDSYDIQTGLYGIGGIDFLQHDNAFYGNIDYIITNPPYTYATAFIQHSKKIASKKIAMLLKLNALAGLDRFKKIWSDKEFPLKKIIIFVKRLDFMLKNPPTLEYCWCIWDKSYKGNPQLYWDIEILND